MTASILVLALGLFVLILGGELLVRGASSIALRLHLSPLVVGLTIVAFGTSAPELLISLKSAINGSPDLAMGNVIGSNICNLALVLGITAVISPIKVNANSLRIDWPMTMGSSLLLYLLIREGYVNHFEGVLFVTLLILYTVFIIRKSRKENKALAAEHDVPEAPSKSTWRDVLLIVLGALGLFYGAEWFVGSAQDLAVMMGVSERVIGITVLALGTSLPELVTASVAAFKKETDIALGNLMGSNIFNILSILGITSIVKEIHVSDAIIQFDIWWMIGITLILLPVMMIRRVIGRLAGAMLLLIYFYYTYTVILA